MKLLLKTLSQVNHKFYTIPRNYYLTNQRGYDIVRDIKGVW